MTGVSARKFGGSTDGFFNEKILSFLHPFSLLIFFD